MTSDFASTDTDTNTNTPIRTGGFPPGTPALSHMKTKQTRICCVNENDLYKLFILVFRLMRKQEIQMICLFIPYIFQTVLTILASISTPLLKGFYIAHTVLFSL